MTKPYVTIVRKDGKTTAIESPASFLRNGGKVSAVAKSVIFASGRIENNQLKVTGYHGEKSTPVLASMTDADLNRAWEKMAERSFEAWVA